MRAVADSAQRNEACLILGVILLALGAMPLANGLYGYYVTLPEIERSHAMVNEAAKELGLEGIDVSSTDSIARLFLVMILVGGSAVIAGATLLLIALSRRGNVVERRP